MALILTMLFYIELRAGRKGRRTRFRLMREIGTLPTSHQTTPTRTSHKKNKRYSLILVFGVEIGSKTRVCQPAASG